MAWGLVHSVRMFALTNTADALIGCWRAKYDEAFWQPITAIHLADTDCNPATTADPTWTPLATTPPYHEYPSGHACVTGSVTRSLGLLFGPRDLGLDVSSAVTGTSRHFDTARELNRETKNARIWLGFHFRKAMTDGTAGAAHSGLRVDPRVRARRPLSTWSRVRYPCPATSRW